MQEVCLRSSGYTFVALLKACAKCKDLKRGSELHADVMSLGLLSKDVFVGSALVAMYAKCVELAKAQEVFDQLPIRNVVSWNALIAGYTKQAHGKKALHLFEKMQLDGISPNTITFICSLKACASIEAIDKGSEIHAEIARKGLLKESSNLCCALVDMYAKCGSLEKAQELLTDKFFNQSVDAWNALISGYVKHMRGDEALHCFEQMQSKGILPDAITFACTLKACGSTRAAEIGCQIHVEIARKGLLETDALLGSSLVDMYFKCGLLAKAQEVFDGLFIQDAVSWTTLIAGYADHNHAAEALICYEQMQLEGLLADSITFTCSLKACGSIEASLEGIQIHAEIERRSLLRGEVRVGHAVVDMYAKCGLFAKAFEVFHRISRQDVVLWNVLIAGYANHERGEEALNCLECMHLEGVSPDAISFACSLKACGSIGATDTGREIHAEVVSKGLIEQHLSVGNALIDMYGKCGLVAEARDVLHSLSIRDTVSWNALIAGYANHIHGEAALNCFEQMQSEGVFPNSITFSCILKACGSIQAADKGIGIHSELVIRGLLKGTNLVLCSMVIDMYIKCGFFKEAQEVFDKLPFKCPFTWNSLILGYVEEGHEDEALQLLEQMQLDGVLLDDVTFSCSLKACGSVGATDKGRDLHAEIDRIGLFESNIVGIALVDMYVKFYLLAKAQEVFDKLLVREVLAWNTLISGFAKHGCGEDALKCLQQMQLEGVHPDAITFTGILIACGSIGARVKGREIHAVIQGKRSFERDLVVSNALIDMYAKCGLIGKAQELFEKLPVRNTVSWNALIAAYAKLDYGKEALSYFKQMQSEGLLPDTITLACSLKACGSIGALSEGIEIHAEVERKGLMDRDSLVGNALVDMYAKHGLLTKAQEVFDQLPIQDVVSRNALITGFLKYGHFEEALSCFEQMQLGGVSFDAISFVCILKACASIGALEKGQVVHAEIERDGLLGEDLNVVNSLIDMYAKCGSLLKASEVFSNSLQNRDLVSWNKFITGHAQLGDGESVFRILNRMEGEGIKPDSVTSLGVLSACNHEGLVDKAEIYFNVICKTWEITPTVEHHTCMVDLLGRAGQLDRAATFMKEIPFHPDIVMSCSFLGACRKWGSVELATQAFEQAVLCDENDVEAHVYMFNIYADADMQENASPFKTFQC